MYYRHSGYPGGLKSRTLNDMLERRPEEVIRLAVKGMLPRNRLARKQLTKLKVYAGPRASPRRAAAAADGDQPLMAEENRPPEDERPPSETPRAEEAPVEETPAAEEPRRRRRRAPTAEEATPTRLPEEAELPAAEAGCRAAERRGRRRGRRGADEDDRGGATPRVKPAIPGMDLEVDIVREGEAALRGESETTRTTSEELRGRRRRRRRRAAQPIADASIDLAAGARYRATGKRKTAVARVTLKPGTGAYVINGRTLDEYFPRFTLQRNIRQPLETVGYEERMDVVANIHGGGVSAQAGALRHGISRALLEADPEPPHRAQAPRLPHA